MALIMAKPPFLGSTSESGSGGRAVVNWYKRKRKIGYDGRRVHTGDPVKIYIIKETADGKSANVDIPSGVPGVAPGRAWGSYVTRRGLLYIKLTGGLYAPD